MAMPLKLLLVGEQKFGEGPLIEGLRSGNFEPTVTRVQTKTALRRALEIGPWDAVICDFDFERQATRYQAMFLSLFL